VTDLSFTHLTTYDGLSQSYVNAILQDRRGFMWFGTRDGLNRYDGNDFVVYKHNPSDPGSLSANYVENLMEDDQGYLWVATFSGGVDRFDPTTERFTHYRHDPNNPNSIGSDWVERIARDSRGYLWFGTGDSGLDKFDPATATFTHYLKDSDGRFVGEITDVIADSHGESWFVGERGLFHLSPQTGQITRPPVTIGLAADYVYEDRAGNLWMLAYSPTVGLVKDDRQAERLTKYPVGAGAVGVACSNLLANGQTGLWVPSSQGLYYFDRRAERFTYRFQHEETNRDSLNDNTVVSVYEDRGGLLWVGTENGGLNLFNLRQEQFGAYRHRPADPNSLSPGEVSAIYEEPNRILWVGFYPRALDRLDLKTGQVTHYVPGPENKNALGKGRDVNGIYQDARGYLWLSGWEAGLDRFDEGTGQFKHYRHNPDDPNSLITNYVFTIYGDRSGQIWVGQNNGISRFDPVAEQFTNYRPDPRNPTSYGNWALTIYQDRSGTLWFGRGGGVLSRFDDKTKTLVSYTPDSRDPHRLQGGNITAIHEDRAGTLWLGALDGLYRFNRQNGTITRYTQGLPSSIQCILEDKAGRLWLGTKKGISRFDPQTETFRNYDVSDGLQSNEFGKVCYQSPDGEMFFGGSNGFNAFFPESIRDNPYVPPVVLTSFKIFNKPVPIGAKSVLTKVISYADSLTLAYRDNVFSFEFAALSYANSQKNRYRYKLEPLEPGWNEVGSKQHLATYTNLDPGKYTFRVQGSNSDGVWNEEGVSLPILVTPPWWKTIWFRALGVAMVLALLWAAYQFRVHQLQRESKQLRDVIETIPAMAWTALPDGSNEFVNRRWLEYTGLSQEETAGSGWHAAIHPEDLARHAERWCVSVAAGQRFENEARFRRAADGEYRWFLVRGVPLRDGHGNILKWYGILADIEDRKRTEEERERLRQLEADLAHINRVSMLGELAASIAHEVNQPLSGIVSSGSACLRWLAADPPNLEEAWQSVHRWWALGSTPAK
jgi:PAS domain S-box-containing protein